MSLLVQFDSTYTDKYKRILYLFVCLNSDLMCNSKSFGFKAFRYLIKNCSYNEINALDKSRLIIENPTTTDSIQLSELNLDTLAAALNTLKIKDEDTKTLSEKREINTEHTKYIVYYTNEYLPSCTMRFEAIDDEVNKYLHETNNKTNTFNSNYIIDSESTDEDEEQTIKDDLMFQLAQAFSYAPDQIIRYEINGKALWISCPNSEIYSIITGKENVISCQYCGSKNVFEYQIFASLINIISEKSDSTYGIYNSKLFFSNIVIYTCINDCYNFINSNYEVLSQYIVIQSV